jgi:hypothetical protein
MKARHLIALSMLAGVAAVGVSLPCHAEDKYIKNLPLDALTVPVPVIPPQSTLDLRPARTPDAGDQFKHPPGGNDDAPPSIGFSIKTPAGK